MAQLKFGSAGVTTREIDLSGPITQVPTGIPAGVIGTATQGPAFVPVTVGSLSDFYAKFGKTDGKKFGPLAVTEWLRNASAVTYLRVLGVGDGKKRNSDGTVTNAGFVVGENLPSSTGLLQSNPYARGSTPGAGNPSSVQGRTYFLGCYMSESTDRTWLTDAGIPRSAALQNTMPILRGVLMAPSGVILRLSSSGDSYSNLNTPISTLPPTDGVVDQFPTVSNNVRGFFYGGVKLQSGAQEFCLVINGLVPSDKNNLMLTASFDMTAPNYFPKVFNSDPYKIQERGHYLYAYWDMHPSNYVLTGSGLLGTSYGLNAAANKNRGIFETSCFITTGSLSRNVGSDTSPNYENWQDRFRYAKTPWVISQDFGGNEYNLFRLHALSAGSGVSERYKFSIENLAPSSDPLDRYGTFDLIVRDWNDYDLNVKAIEQFRGLSLNPSSDRYIAKIIGDVNAYYDFDQPDSNQQLVVEGNYPNRSNVIRIEMSPSIEAGLVDPTALPFGFRGPAHLMTSGSSPINSIVGAATIDSHLAASPVTNPAYRVFNSIQTPPIRMRRNIAVGPTVKISVDPTLYWGVQFEHMTNWSEPNGSLLKDTSMTSFVKYFPDFTTTTMPIVVGDNAGASDTATNGIVDSDRYHNNKFSLSKIKVYVDANGNADPTRWAEASYVRSSAIIADAYTRAFRASDLIQENRKYAKFTFFMQGGFDGVNLFDKNEAEINNTAAGYDMDDSARGRQNGPTIRSYVKALDVMKNTSIVDIQLLAIPGIRHPYLTNTAVSAVEERYDSMYVMDIEQVDSNNVNVSSDSQLPSVTLSTSKFAARQLDSSFAAAYFPDVVITDPNTGTNVTVPPSVAVLGALALNDKLGHPWFAPAGFARGALQTTLEPRVRLSKKNMDDLYDSRVNPLAAFPGNSTTGINPTGGVVVWGQKTLQLAASALDRVNVRRLLIDLRRQVRDIARTIIFEPNRETTLAQFSAAVTPRLQRVQALAGLDRFRVIIDSSTTTQLDIENNTIRGKIFVQPTKSIEFVSLDFVVTNNIGE